MKNFILILIGFFFSLQAFGQEKTDLFNNSSRVEINFNQKQSTKLNRMIKNPIYLNHYFVTVNDLETVNRSGYISVNLPDKNKLVYFKKKEIKYSSRDEFVYYGEIAEYTSSQMGYIHLIAKNGNLFGQINIEDEIYELQDFGERKNVLFKIDPSIYTEKECAVTYDPSIRNNNNDIKINTPENNDYQERTTCNVRVLVLFTANADAVGNPANSASLLMQQTNQIMSNSDADVTFTLAGVQELTGFTETNNITQTRDNLQSNTTANQLRDDFEADLVVLLTDGNWNGIFGISFLNEWGDEDFGYALAEIDAAGGRYTFTHEIAHDFGCKHDNHNAGSPDFVFDARGHNFKQGCCWPFRPTRRTLMNLLGDGSRIMHASNPDVEYGGKDTGVSNSRENADQLSAMGCTIADYRPFTPPMNVNISGPSSGNNSQSYTWCASVTGCSNVTSYSWSYSLNGSSYYSLSTSTSCLTANLPYGSDVWYRVTVTCADGQTDTDWHFVSNFDSDPCDPCGGTIPCRNIPPPCLEKLNKEKEDEGIDSNIAQKEGKLDDLNIENKAINLFPNPTNNLITLEFEVLSNSGVEIEVFDITGRKVKSLLNKPVNKGLYSETFDISDLIDGYYFIRGKIGNQTITESVIKQRL